MYDNSLALMAELRAAGVDYRSDTPEEDENFIDTVRVFMVPEVAGLFGMAAMGRMFDTLDEVHPQLRELLPAY